MLSGSYTLFTRIPVYLATNGSVLTDPLWCKDLELHLDYIEDFRLCCPAGSVDEAPGSSREVKGLQASQVISLHRSHGWKSVFLGLLPNFRRVAAAVRNTHIVHSGGAGWPFPLSFYILLLRPFLNFKWIMVIESSFWMKPTTRRPSLRERFSHHAHARLLRACLRSADARIFTQDGYRRFFGIGEEAVLIAPAIWIDEEHLLTDEAQQKRLAQLPTDEIRFLFPARLVADKGVDTVLQAVERLETLLQEDAAAPSGRIILDIVGSGDLADTCRAFAARHQGEVTVRFQEPVSYGAPFFSLLREYHAIILANRQDEQPRVIFDAFSQGVAVISSRTPGVESIVSENLDALLFERNDADGLARRLLEFASQPELRHTLLLNSLRAVRGKSHVDMHKTRAQFLEKTLARG